jgi:hypothetical protein
MLPICGGQIGNVSSVRDPDLVGMTRATLLTCGLILFHHLALIAEPVVVRRTEGVVHGFLVLRTLDGKRLADGDLIQVPRGGQVTSRLTFRFKDGSIHEESAVYTQRRYFRLLSSRLVQKGPTFPRTLDMSVDATKDRVRVRYMEEDGEEKTEDEQLELPPDLANGLILTVVKNLSFDGKPATVSLVAATPKPRVVKLEISPSGREPFSTGGTSREALHYVVKVEIGGIAGLLAPLVGKQPPDSHVWVLGGEAPAFVKAELPLYLGGPLWRIELVSPVWPHSARHTQESITHARKLWSDRAERGTGDFVSSR